MPTGATRLACDGDLANLPLAHLRANFGLLRSGFCFLPSDYRP